MKSFSTDKIYYVYGLADPKNDEVFYIGKGKGKRAEQHFQEVYIEGKGNKAKLFKIKEIQKLGLEPTIKYFATDIEEEASLVLEEILIDRIGREILNYGPLTNLLTGGRYETELKVNLSSTEKVTKEEIQERFPYLIDIINKIPRTTKEDDIKAKWKEVVDNVVTKIKSYDSEILELIEAKNIKYIFSPYGEAISFQSIFGIGSINFDDDDRYKSLEDGNSSIYFRRNDEIIYKETFLPQSDIVGKLRELYNNRNNYSV